MSPTGIQTHLPSVSSQIPQGFVPLPPLPAFAFRPQYPPTASLYSQPPFPETVSSNQKLSEADETQNTSATTALVSPPGGDNSESGENTVISVPKVKEEVVTPPPSSEKIFIKQEPQDNFMLNSSQNVASAKPNMDSYAAKKDMGPILTPKLEPGLSNPYPSANEFPSGSNNSKIHTESTLTSQAEVIGHTDHREGQGDKVECQEIERPEVEIMEDSDSDREGTLTPGPVPTPCNKEILRSKTAM